MKVKVGDIIYDDFEEPIMVILTDFDKANILSMPKDNTKYASFPDNWKIEDAEDWMET